MGNFIKHLGKGEATIGEVHVDKRGLDNGIVNEDEEEDLIMDELPAREIWREIERLEQEKEGVKIEENIMGTHAKVDGK